MRIECPFCDEPVWAGRSFVSRYDRLIEHRGRELRLSRAAHAVGDDQTRVIADWLAEVHSTQTQAEGATCAS